MHFGRKLISAISFSTLLVASNGYEETAPFFNDEEEIRGLDSSCACSFSDLIGSDFSCTYYSTYSMGIPNFGEDQSVCTQYTDGSISRTYTFVETTSSRATYTHYAGTISFQLDPTQAENGECSVSKGVFSFGCWACPPPTSFPSFVPTDSPSVQASDQPSDQPSENVNPTDDVGNNDTVNPTDDDEDDEDDEECWFFDLFSSLQKLFFSLRLDII